MNIIKIKPNQNQSYPPIQTWEVSYGAIPKGYALVPANIDTSVMQKYYGFVNLTVENNVVTDITGNEEAYQNYLASLPEPEPEPLDEVTKLKLAIAELAAIVELNQSNEVNTNG